MKTKISARKKAKKIEPTLWIGKNGLSGSAIEEIEKQLKKKRLIKVKILKSALENVTRKGLASEIKERTKADIIELVGNIIVLKKDDN